MPPPRIAVASHLFGQPLKNSLMQAARIGAQAVQIDARHELKPADLSETGQRQFLHFLDELDLSVSSMHFPTRRALCHSDQLDARVSAIKSAMQFTFALKAKVLTVRIGRIPQEQDSDEFRLLRDVLNDLAGYGNHVGVTLAITPSSESEKMLSTAIDSATEGPLGINFDPSVFVGTNRSPAEVLRTIADRLVHVQIHDAIRDVDGRNLEVPVGRGEVAWDELLPTIDEIGYNGWLTVDRTTGDDKPGDAARAIQFLRRLSVG